MNKSVWFDRKFLAALSVIVILVIPLLVLSFKIRSSQQVTNIKATNLAESQTALFKKYPDFPIYPGAEFVSSEDNLENKFSATWVVSDSIPRVMSWYISNLISQGWGDLVPPANSNDESLQYAELFKDNQRMQLSIIKDSTDNKVKIVVEMPKMPTKQDNKSETGEQK